MRLLLNGVTQKKREIKEFKMPSEIEANERKLQQKSWAQFAVCKKRNMYRCHLCLAFL